MASLLKIRNSVVDQNKMAAKATNFILIIGVIIKVIFATLSERKVKGSKQRRVGPNTVGYKGL